MSQHFHIMYIISRHTRRTTNSTNTTASQSSSTFLTTGCSKKTWTSLQALQGVYENDQSTYLQYLSKRASGSNFLSAKKGFRANLWSTNLVFGSKVFSRKHVHNLINHIHVLNNLGVVILKPFTLLVAVLFFSMLRWTCPKLLSLWSTTSQAVGGVIWVARMMYFPTKCGALLEPKILKITGQ